MLRRHTETEKFWQTLGSALKFSRTYVAAAIVLLMATWLALIVSATPPTRSHAEVTFTIRPGTPASRVAEALKANALIRSTVAFNVVLHIGYGGKPVVAGTYRIRRDQRLFDVVEILVEGKTAKARVVIPEGFTLAQIAARLQKHNVVTDAAQFTQLASTSAADFGIDSPTGSLEGYLFPDTYTFAPDTPAREVIKQMVDAFRHRVLDTQTGAVIASGLSLHEVITLASLIEREARAPEDRPVIASVIRNRLRAGMPLQVDATVQYALVRRSSRVLYRDLRVDSPYNTYKRRGLPPGPIANPGMSCILAALHPAQTDYLFYVARPDGTHAFAADFNAHRANVQRSRPN